METQIVIKNKLIQRFLEEEEFINFFKSQFMFDLFGSDEKKREKLFGDEVKLFFKKFQSNNCGIHKMTKDFKNKELKMIRNRIKPEWFKKIDLISKKVHEITPFNKEKEENKKPEIKTSKFKKEEIEKEEIENDEIENDEIEEEKENKDLKIKRKDFKRKAYNANGKKISPRDCKCSQCVKYINFVDSEKSPTNVKSCVNTPESMRVVKKKRNQKEEKEEKISIKKPRNSFFSSPSSSDFEDEPKKIIKREDSNRNNFDLWI